MTGGFAVLHRNIAFKALEAAVVIVCSLLEYSLITHSIPAENVGTYALVSTWATFLSAFSMSQGLLCIVSRDLAQGADIDTTLSNAIFLQVSMSIVVGVFSILATTYFSENSDTQSIIVVTGVVFLFVVPLQLSQSILASRDSIHILGLTCSIGTIITLGVLYLVIDEKYSMYIVCLAGISEVFFVGCINYLIAPLHRNFKISLVTPKKLKSLFLEAMPSLIMFVASSLYIRVDVLMIEYFNGKSAVAQYSTTYVILDNLMIVSNTLISALFPTFSRLAVDDSPSVRVVYARILEFLSVILFPCALFLAYFAKPFLGILFGVAYQDGALTLQILMTAAIFAWINGPAGSILIAYGKQRLYMWGTLLGVVVNVIGNIFLIPYLGNEGAAIGTALTEFFLCVFSMAMVYRCIGYAPFSFIGWVPPCVRKFVHVAQFCSLFGIREKYSNDKE